MRRRALLSVPSVAAAVAAFLFALTLSPAVSASPAQSPTVNTTLTTARFMDGHPVNEQGYVVDGSPQLDDAHCSTPPGSGLGSTPVQQFACLAARHPGLAQWIAYHSSPERVIARSGRICGWEVVRWAPELLQYPWPLAEMERIMCGESDGNPGAHNPDGACGLMQLYPCPPGGMDGDTNIRLAWSKYDPSLGAWSQTR